MKPQKFLWIFTVAALPLWASEDLPNLQEPWDRVITAGQPTPEGLKAAKARGCVTVVNLREESEDGFLADERSLVKGLGMRYVTVPMTPDTITEKKVKAFGRAVCTPENQPVLVHCGSANRVGGMWFLWRTRHQGISREQALDEARGIGMKPSLEEKILKWDAEHPAAKAKNPKKEKSRKDSGKGGK